MDGAITSEVSESPENHVTTKISRNNASASLNDQIRESFRKQSGVIASSPDSAVPSELQCIADAAPTLEGSDSASQFSPAFSSTYYPKRGISFRRNSGSIGSTGGMESDISNMSPSGVSVGNVTTSSSPSGAPVYLPSRKSTLSFRRGNEPSAVSAYQASVSPAGTIPDARAGVASEDGAGLPPKLPSRVQSMSFRRANNLVSLPPRPTEAIGEAPGDVTAGSLLASHHPPQQSLHAMAATNQDPNFAPSMPPKRLSFRRGISPEEERGATPNVPHAPETGSLNAAAGTNLPPRAISFRRANIMNQQKIHMEVTSPGHSARAASPSRPPLGEGRSSSNESVGEKEPSKEAVTSSPKKSESKDPEEVKIIVETFSSPTAKETKVVEAHAAIATSAPEEPIHEQCNGAKEPVKDKSGDGGDAQKQEINSVATDDEKQELASSDYASSKPAHQDTNSDSVKAAHDDHSYQQPAATNPPESVTSDPERPDPLLPPRAKSVRFDAHAEARSKVAASEYVPPKPLDPQCSACTSRKEQEMLLAHLEKERSRLQSVLYTKLCEERDHQELKRKNSWWGGKSTNVVTGERTLLRNELDKLHLTAIYLTEQYSQALKKEQAAAKPSATTSSSTVSATPK